jgi:hypothetical protein
MSPKPKLRTEPAEAGQCQVNTKEKIKKREKIKVNTRINLEHIFYRLKPKFAVAY